MPNPTPTASLHSELTALRQLAGTASAQAPGLVSALDQLRRALDDFSVGVASAEAPDPRETWVRLGAAQTSLGAVVGALEGVEHHLGRLRFRLDPDQPVRAEAV